MWAWAPCSTCCARDGRGLDRVGAYGKDSDIILNDHLVLCRVESSAPTPPRRSTRNINVHCNKELPLKVNAPLSSRVIDLGSSR